MQWPLVGRERHLDNVTAVFTARSAHRLVVHGTAGVGKSRLLVEAAARAARAGVDVRWVLATSATAQVPYGAFASLLPPDLDVDRPGGMLAAAGTYLASSPGRWALAIDDAHLLDPGSAALLQYLAMTSDVPFVVTVRDGEDVPDAVMALWKDLDVPRLAVAALDRAEVDEALRGTLGEVSSALVDDLARLSHGNPLLLAELVTAAVAAGTIEQREQLWVARGPVVTAESLSSAITARLDGLAPAVRAGAELIALAEPVDAAVVESLLSDDVRGALEEQSLLVRAADVRQVQLRLSHPLFTEVLRATVPPLRAREHARKLADAAAQFGTDRPEDRLRVAMWHLDAGRRDDPALYLAAARVAHAVEDHELAVRLADAATDAGGGLDAELMLVQQLPYVGRDEEALRRVDELQDAWVEPADQVQLAIAAAWLHALGGDITRADGVLAAARSFVSTPELSNGIRAERARIAHQVGAVTTAVTVADELLAQPALDGVTLTRTATWCVRALGLAGRPDDGIALADRAQDILEDVDQSARRRDEIAMARGHALAYAGRVGAAVDMLQTGAARAHGALRSLWFRDLGQSLLMTGKPQSSLAALREVLAELPLAGYGAPTAMWTLDAMAEASALLGDLDQARAHLAERERRRPAGFHLPRTAGEVWVHVAEGDTPAARRRSLEIAGQHAARGAAIPQALALYDVARLGDAAGVQEQLTGLATSCQGHLVSMLAEAAAALAAADAGAMVAAADALQARGYLLWGAELLARATPLHRRAGSTGLAFALSQRAAELTPSLEGARTPLLAELDTTTDLTDREREVAMLVAGGYSDREVAERLHLSVRTVHSHLHHTYRKLGIGDRHELSVLLGRRPTDMAGPTPDPTAARGA